MAMHVSNSIIKFADDKTVFGLITKSYETAYREETSALVEWCHENNLSLNINKMKELIMDYRRQQREHAPICIDWAAMERVKSFRFLGMRITEDLKWSLHTDSVVKKVQHHLFIGPITSSLAPKTFTNLYRCTIESILSGCITAWYGNFTIRNHRALQR